MINYEFNCSQCGHSGTEEIDIPKKEWVGLTVQEAADCWTTSASKTWHNLEAKLKEKNT